MATRLVDMFCFSLGEKVWENVMYPKNVCAFSSPYRVNVKGSLAKWVLCRRAPQNIKENWRPRCPLTIRSLWKRSGGKGKVHHVVDPSIEQSSALKGNIGVLRHHATLTQCFVRCLRCCSSSPVDFRGCAPKCWGSWSKPRE